MISWIVIALLIVGIMFIVRAKHMKHRIFVIILIIVGLFLYSTLMIVSYNNDLRLDNATNVYSAFKVYLGWLGNAITNMKGVIGNAVKMDWTSSNSSLLNISKAK